LRYSIAGEPEKPPAADASAVVDAVPGLKSWRKDSSRLLAAWWMRRASFTLSIGISSGFMGGLRRRSHVEAGQRARSGEPSIDKGGDLLVVSSDGSEGTVYSFRPGSSEEDLR